MKKLVLIKIAIISLCFLFILVGCSSSKTDSDLGATTSVEPSKTTIPSTEINTENVTEKQEIKSNANTVEIDLGSYFQGINGCAVIYSEDKNEYSFYNQKLCDVRSSPCSTFKIISTLLGLESGVLKSKDTKINWGETKYPVEEWNQDMTLEQAFKTSCVWYFRDVIDSVGVDVTNRLLSDLSYGNCDISQWAGSNTNGNSKELNGFWLESSLLISPKEQVDVLRNIFEDKTNINKDNIAILKEIMQTDDSNNVKIYGKTGTGFKDNACVDAWFVGMAENENNRFYFAIRLDDPQNKSATGQKSKEIAINILSDFLK